MKAKTLSIMALILAFLMLPMSVFAESGSAVLTATAEHSEIGNTVTISISLKTNVQEGETVSSLRAQLSYDPDALSFQGYELTDEKTRKQSVAGDDAVWGVNDSKNGIVEFAFANSEGCTDDGFLIALLFRTEKSGTYELRIQNSEYGVYNKLDQVTTNYDMDPKVLSVITVSEANTPEPTEEPTPEPTEEPTSDPTEEPTPEPTEEPTPEPTEEPTPTPTKRPTATPREEEEEDDPIPWTRRPTATPTRTPTPTPTYTPYITAIPIPTGTPTAIPSAVPTETPTSSPKDKEGHRISDGEGGCASCSDSSIGIMILDIGIAFLAIQIVIVVLVIYRKRRSKASADDSNEEEQETDDTEEHNDVSDADTSDEDIPTLF